MRLAFSVFANFVQVEANALLTFIQARPFQSMSPTRARTKADEGILAIGPFLTDLNVQ